MGSGYHCGERQQRNKGAILTIVERKKGFLIAEKLNQGKNAKALAKTLVRLLLPFKEAVHSITSDNGGEFVGHKYTAKILNAQFYFAHPYSSWERGLNEYTNKLIRQYIPKKNRLINITTNILNKYNMILTKDPEKN